jgi:acyl carrier protein phosphodiesterase
MLGNFIGDYVKGSKYKEFPEQVAFGIKLHRSIDLFTDQHPDVRKCIELLKPGYGRYGGIVVDVFFDHFLAANWTEHSIYTLRDFSKHAHAVFLSNFRLLPFRVKQFLPFLISNRRFESYARRDSLRQVLEIMARHTSLPAGADWAMDVLSQEYWQFDGYFRSFFKELTDYVETDFGIEISKPVAEDFGKQKATRV